jgi:predicted aspartyl protease
MKKIITLILAFTVFYPLKSETSKTDRPDGYYEKIDFEFTDNKIIIPVSIDGTVYRFLFDTGAPNVISKDLFRKINPKVLKTTKTHDAAGNSDDLKIVSIPEIHIGKAVFKKTKALVYDLSNIDIFKCYDIDGFIGSNLLKNSIVQIDFTKKTLILTDNHRNMDLEKSGSVKMAVLGEQSSPFIFIELKGSKNARDQVMIDTGMDGFYDLSHRSYDIFKNNEILKDLATATGGSIVSLFGNEQMTEQHRVLVPELNVAGVKFKGLVTITTADNISRIGIDMLKHGITTIDFKNKRFYFDADGETVDVSKPLPGFTPTVENGRLVVGYVWDKKLKSKLSYGDEIIKIQDTDISKMKFCDFLKQKHIFEKADTLSIVFKTKTGDISNITIIKETPEL